MNSESSVLGMRREGAERGGRSQSLIPSDFQTSLKEAISADIVNGNVNGKKATDVGWRAVSTDYFRQTMKGLTGQCVWTEMRKGC